MTSTGNFDGRNALVCGATGGLGSRLVRRLTDGGASVTAVGRSESGLAALDAHATVALDLRLPNACRLAVETAAASGPIDLLVNAVGVVAFGAVDELSTDIVEEVFLTNTFIPVFLSTAALPHMAEGGLIVQIPGVIAEKNLPGMSVYGASKAAVVSFDESLRREARRRKIGVLDVFAPHTDTGLADRAIAGSAPKLPEGMEPERVVERILEAIAERAEELRSDEF